MSKLENYIQSKLDPSTRSKRWKINHQSDVIHARKITETERAEFLSIVKYNEGDIEPLKLWIPKAWIQEQIQVSPELVELRMVKWASTKGYVKKKIDLGIAERLEEKKIN